MAGVIKYNWDFSVVSSGMVRDRYHGHMGSHGGASGLVWRWE